MNIIVTIAGEDKTSLIDWPSFEIEDNIDEQPNLCNFNIKVYAGQSYKPEVGDEVVVNDGDDVIFGGKILSIKNTIDSDVISFSVECKDYTGDLDNILVTESFTDTNVGAIIQYIVDNYLTGVTYANVSCSIAVTRVAFNKMPISKCLSELASLTNYIWYIDYDKDIHFFAKSTEVAPFSIVDDSDYLIANSLSLSDDLSQLRNVVIIRGGDKVADNTRSKTHTGDGTQKTFNTDYKFNSAPTVTVGGVSKTVGTENLNTTGYDCYWDYNQKYIRFENAPAGSSAIVITGYPLIPIIVQAEDLGSIGRYGRAEFAKTERSIKSSDEALSFAMAQLESYGNSVREGSFDTYESGLKSGQTISINLTDFGVNATFIIQRVVLRLVSQTKGQWGVELATTKTLGIIQYLQNQLIAENKAIDYNSNDVLEKYYMDNQQVNVTEEINVLEKMEDFQDVVVTEEIAKDPFGAGVWPDFVLCPYEPTGNNDPKREFMLDRSYLG